MPKIVKITTFPKLLDLIMPHSCRGCNTLGSVLCNRCKNHIISCNFNICPNCRKDKHSASCKTCKNFPPSYILGPREGLLSDLIHDYKYNSTRAIGGALAEIFAAKLPNIQNAVIVPLPTSTAHVRSRGFDHTYYLAKRIARIKKYRVTKLLLRDKNTVQVGADKSTRLRQADEAYSINPHIKIDNTKTYILLDDVWTTGASMTAAIKKLRDAGVQNIIVSLIALSELD